MIEVGGWQVITFFVSLVITIIGMLVGFGKILLAQFESKLNEKFKFTEEKYRQLHDDIQTANQIIVKFFDPVAKKEEQAIANNIAAIQMHGVISKTVEYRGIPTFDLAARVAQRDLEMTASGLMRLKIVFDMRGSAIKPGDVFKVHLPERDIQSAVFRATRLENGNEGEIIITCMQDVFGLPAANYSTKQTESLYKPPDYSAKPILHSRTFEVPYHMYPMVFNSADLAFIKSTDCYIRALADLPSPLSTNFVMQVDSGAGFGGRAIGAFSPSVVITDALTPYQTQFRFAQDGNTSGLSGCRQTRGGTY